MEAWAKTAASKREQFSYKSLVDKDEIGEGGFTVIFTARLLSSDSAKIVVKKLLASDKEARKALVKEAWIINKLWHPNGVEFKGICTDKYALLLEYVHFDFTSLGLKVSTHSLADFSAICEQSSCEGMDASGLKYLHDNNITQSWAIVWLQLNL